MLYRLYAALAFQLWILGGHQWFSVGIWLMQVAIAPIVSERLGRGCGKKIDCSKL